MFIGIGIAPEGATLDYTDALRRADRGALRRRCRRSQQYFVVTGFPVVNQVISFVRLKDWDEREAHAAGDRGRAGAEDVRHPGVLAFASNPPSLGQSPTEKPVQFVHPDLAALRGAADRWSTRCWPRRANFRACVNVDTDLKLNKPRAEDRPRPRQGRRSSGVEVDDRRPHAGDHARRPPGHALQARTASSTT